MTGHCHKGRCYSPIACESFGYCREHNLRTDLTEEQRADAIRIGRIEFKSAGATRKR